jgi:hypothetical protein
LGDVSGRQQLLVASLAVVVLALAYRGASARARARATAFPTLDEPVQVTPSPRFEPYTYGTGSPPRLARFPSPGHGLVTRPGPSSLLDVFPADVVAGLRGS